MIFKISSISFLLSLLPFLVLSTSDDNQTTTIVPADRHYEVRLSKSILNTLIETTELLELLLESDGKSYTTENIDVRFTCLTDDLFNWNKTDHSCEVITLDGGFNYQLKTNVDRLNISLKSISPGKQQLVGHVQYNKDAIDVNARKAYVTVNVGRSDTIILVSSIIGWIYFVSWSISFYPQIWYNFRRRSVVGLNFDYVALNLTGFLSYSVFNVALFSITYVQRQFEEINPRSQIPIELNDVVFGLHAVFATLVVIGQCLFYERGDQKISYFAQGMLAIIWIGYVVIGFIVAFTEWITLLNFLYVFSYVKLTITIVKYIPQAWYNYQRKSTIGWSIGNIFLDFLGGMLSIVQMFMLAYNYDDWVTIFKNFTKFGLGAVSIMFDVLFLLQHYVFYRHQPASEAARLCVGEDGSAIGDSKEDLTRKESQINYGAFDREKV